MWCRLKLRTSSARRNQHNQSEDIPASWNILKVVLFAKSFHFQKSEGHDRLTSSETVCAPEAVHGDLEGEQGKHFENGRGGEVCWWSWTRLQHPFLSGSWPSHQ